MFDTYVSVSGDSFDQLYSNTLFVTHRVDLDCTVRVVLLLRIRLLHC